MSRLTAIRNWFSAPTQWVYRQEFAWFKNWLRRGGWIWICLVLALEAIRLSFLHSPTQDWLENTYLKSGSDELSLDGLLILLSTLIIIVGAATLKLVVAADILNQRTLAPFAKVGSEDSKSARMIPSEAWPAYLTAPIAFLLACLIPMFLYNLATYPASFKEEAEWIAHFHHPTPSFFRDNLFAVIPQWTATPIAEALLPFALTVFTAQQMFSRASFSRTTVRILLYAILLYLAWDFLDWVGHHIVRASIPLPSDKHMRFAYREIREKWVMSFEYGGMLVIEVVLIWRSLRWLRSDRSVELLAEKSAVARAELDAM